MEINKIISNALSGVFPRQDLVFTNKKTEWETNSRRPQEIVENIIVKGRLQPLSPAMLHQMGFNIQEHEYYKVYINDITPTQADKIKQMSSSTFIYNNEKYNVVGKMSYNTNGWQELYCYKTEEALYK